jgi:hypothetical protein
MHLACATDAQALCADKASGVAENRCIVYHRLRLSQPCKDALDHLQVAFSGG